MSEYLVQRQSLENIADEIRVLSGTTEPLGLDQMATHVAEANDEVSDQAEVIYQFAEKIGVDLDETNSPRDTVTYNGRLGGRVAVSAAEGGWYVKISSSVLTAGDLLNGAVICVNENGSKSEIPLTSNNIYFDDTGFGFVANGVIIIIPYDSYFYSEDLYFPEKGLYVAYSEPNNAYVSKVTVPGYYFANGIMAGAGSADTLDWNGSSSIIVPCADYFSMGFVSDAVPVITDFDNGCECTLVDVSNSETTTHTLTREHIVAIGSDGIISIAEGPIIFAIIVPFDNAEADGTVFPKKGTYLLVLHAGDIRGYTSKLTIPGYTGFPCGSLLEANGITLQDMLETTTEEVDTQATQIEEIMGLLEGKSVPGGGGSGGVETCSVNLAFSSSGAPIDFMVAGTRYADGAICDMHATYSDMVGSTETFTFDNIAKNTIMTIVCSGRYIQNDIECTNCEVKYKHPSACYAAIKITGTPATITMVNAY